MVLRFAIVMVDKTRGISSFFLSFFPVIPVPKLAIYLEGQVRTESEGDSHGISAPTHTLI